METSNTPQPIHADAEVLPGGAHRATISRDPYSDPKIAAKLNGTPAPAEDRLSKVYGNVQRTTVSASGPFTNNFGMDAIEVTDTTRVAVGNGMQTDARTAARLGLLEKAGDGSYRPTGKIHLAQHGPVHPEELPTIRQEVQQAEQQRQADTTVFPAEAEAALRQAEAPIPQTQRDSFTRRMVERMAYGADRISISVEQLASEAGVDFNTAKNAAIAMGSRIAAPVEATAQDIGLTAEELAQWARGADQELWTTAIHKLAAGDKSALREVRTQYLSHVRGRVQNAVAYGAKVAKHPNGTPVIRLADGQIMPLASALRKGLI